MPQAAKSRQLIVWQAYPFMNHRDTQHKPLVAISACLCGDPVRYDGRSKWQPKLVRTLEDHLTLEKLCPEVAIGMGIPRPPIQLSKDNTSIAAVGVADPKQNFTQPLSNFADQVISQQQPSTPALHINGYLFKSRSPSCGVGSTPIHKQGIEIGHGNGIVAHRIKQQLPWLPVLEEDDLDSPIAIQRFIFLAYLTNDFLKNNEPVQQFHAHHTRLHQGLHQSWQTQLYAAVNQPHAGRSYLAVLNNALLSLTTTEFARIFSPE